MKLHSGWDKASGGVFGGEVMSTSNPSFRNYCWLCPLYSFDCYSESADLGEGIEIKRIAPEFKKYLENRCSDWSLGDINNTKYMIIFPYRMEVNDESKSIFGNWHVSDVSVNLITAFRLCHAGMVIPGPLVLAKSRNSEFSIFSISKFGEFSRSEFDDILPGMSVGPILTPLTKDGFEGVMSPKYKLHKSDILQIKKLVQNLTRLQGKKEPHNLGIALRRFNSSYHGGFEDRIADRIIDHMIAFEFLYLGDDKELGYKLRLRTAFLLGKQRAKIFKDMSKAYNLRSDIVHGNKQVEMFELEEIIPKTEKYLRQSIRIFLSLLSQGHSLKSLRQGTNNKIAELDENMLTNGRTLALRD